MTFDILRKKKAIEILLALFNGALCVGEIQKAVGGSFSTIYERINELLKADLISEEYLSDDTYGTKPFDKRLLRMTEKGLALIKPLIESGFIRPLLLRKTRQRWIIAILHTLNAVYGKTRLMKLLFLLKNELKFTKDELVGFYRFRAGRYGPFSRAIDNDLEDLRDDGFIEIRVKGISPNEFSEEKPVLHIYKLVPKRPELVQEALANLPLNTGQRLVGLKVFNKMSLIDLLRYVYTNYPDSITNSIIVEKVLGDLS